MTDKLMKDSYRTIKEKSEGGYKDRGSKFIALAYPVKDEIEVKPILNKLRKDYYDARHHCFAYRIGADNNYWRVNDDGEPSGTAGKPIYGQIQSFDLTNILIVVIRYFGGTKLGVPGLINAYRSAAVDSIQDAEIIKMYVKDLFDIQYEYPAMNAVMKIIKDESLDQQETSFGLNCKIRFSVRKSESDRIIEKFKKIKTTKITFINTF